MPSKAEKTEISKPHAPFFQAFDPKTLGAKISNSKTKNPWERKPVSSGQFLSVIQRKILMCAAEIAVLLLALAFLRPRTVDADAQKLAETYFAEHMGYGENQELYRDCFQYMVSDLAGQLTTDAASLLREERSVTLMKMMSAR